jgi:hypothetical protein
VKRTFLTASASVWIIPASLCAAQATLGWREVIALLTKARTQATTCVEVLKSSGDKAALARARLTYGMAAGEMDGVIAGLTTSLVEGADPDRRLRRRGQDDYPEHERCVGRGRQRRSRTIVQGDFQRRRRALDALCRSGQARTRNEEVPVGGRAMAQVWRHRPGNSRCAFSIDGSDLCADPRAGSGAEEGDGPVRPPGARHRIGARRSATINMET